MNKKIISYIFFSFMMTGSLFAIGRPLNFEIVPFDYQNADMKEQICFMVGNDQEIQDRLCQTAESMQEKLLNPDLKSRNMKFHKDVFVCRSLDISQRVYGFISCRKVCQVAYIDNIAVHKDYRCQGVAQSLLCHAESFSKKNGAKSLMLFMAHDNEKAMHSYCKYGFEVDEISSSDVMTAMTKSID